MDKLVTYLLYQIIKKRGKSIGKNCRGFEQVRLKWMVEKRAMYEIKKIAYETGK